MINSFINKKNKCDFLIIGSGAAGSIASKILTDNGKEVILVEEGTDENNKNLQKSFANSLLSSWRNAGVIPILSKTNYAFGEAKCLGGGTYLNGGLIWRTPKMILDKWNKILKTNEYSQENIIKYFEKIENELGVNINFKPKIEGLDSLKLLEISKKFDLKVSNIPNSINAHPITNKLVLGEPSKNNNSVIKKYLYKAKEKGLRIMTNCKAEKMLVKNNKIFSVEMIDEKKKNIFSIP